MNRTAERRFPHWSTIALGVSALAVIVMSMLVDDWLSSPGWWASTVLASMDWWYVRRRTRAIAVTTAANLDERDLAARNFGGWWGQIVLLVLGAVASIMLTVVSRLDGISAQLALQKCGGIVLSFLIFGACVPTLVVASVLTDEHDDCDMIDDLRDNNASWTP
jgi:hypothetical protein